jgi:hypothetical protein
MLRSTACFTIALALGATAAHAAGNVTAAVFDGSLRLTGDGVGNAVRIAPGPDPDSIELEGLAGTTINSLTVTVINGITKNLKADFGAGNDEVYVEDLEVAQDLEIVTGPGADVVDLTDCQVGDDTRITTGPDLDTVVLSTDVFGGRLILQTDAGDDVVGLDLVTVVDRAKLATGQGHDQLTIGGSSEFLDTVTVQTIAGNDTVTIDEAAFNAPVTLTLADDNDAATISNSVFASRVEVNGGPGTDSYTSGGGNSFSAGVSLKKVETIIP